MVFWKRKKDSGLVEIVGPGEFFFDETPEVDPDKVYFNPVPILGPGFADYIKNPYAKEVFIINMEKVAGTYVVVGTEVVVE